MPEWKDEESRRRGDHQIYCTCRECFGPSEEGATMESGSMRARKAAWVKLYRACRFAHEEVQAAIERRPTGRILRVYGLLSRTLEEVEEFLTDEDVRLTDEMMEEGDVDALR